MAEKPAMLQTTSSVYFDVPALDKHVSDMSLPTLWEKSYLCPCRDRKTRQPHQTCPRCHGRGIAFQEPRKLDIIVQSTEKGITSSDLGLIDSGTAIGTPDRSIRVAFRDRITIPTVLVSQSYIFDANQRRIDKGFNMIYDVSSIDFVTTEDGEIVEGDDYEFDFNKNLFIPKQHLLGKNISMNILTTLRYMVADLLKEHRYAKQADGTYESTQQKLLLKREDIFIDKEAFSLGTDDDAVSEMVDTKRPATPTGLNGFFGGGLR